MSILTVQSDQARLQWRETIEAAYVDKKDVVIERYGKPIVTVMSHTKWLSMLRRMKELELTTQGWEKYEEMKADPNKLVTEEQYNELLKAEGLTA